MSHTQYILQLLSISVREKSKECYLGGENGVIVKEVKRAIHVHVVYVFIFQPLRLHQGMQNWSLFNL